jgi:enoyl-CoA hydratase
MSIISELRDQVAIIRLNRLEDSNRLSADVILSLSDSIRSLNSQPHLRVIILTGTGETAFCAGAEPDGLDDLFQHLLNQIENYGVPVIAAVNGVAAGAGCELALACHLRIASANAQFRLSESEPGAMSTHDRRQRLAREFGNERALEMMLTGRTIGAAEALQFGLINRVVPAAELLAQSEALASQIAELAPLAIRACLEAVNQGTQLSLAEGLALESKLFAKLFDTDDVREGTSAFLEKRKPIFKGK